MGTSFFLSLVSEEYGLIISGLVDLIAVFASSSGEIKLFTVRWIIFPFMLFMILVDSSSLSYLTLAVDFRMDFTTCYFYYYFYFFVSFRFSYMTFFLSSLNRLGFISVYCHDTFLLLNFPGL